MGDLNALVAVARTLENAGAGENEPWGFLPRHFIAQECVEPSHVQGFAVDLRPLAVVTLTREIVSPFPWGRAAGEQGRGKTTLSGGGYLSPIRVL